MPENEANACDWGAREVLVGVLHNSQQLENNLACHSYHMPVKILSVPPDTIRYIALYQSKRLFGNSGAGIYFYSKVLSCRQLPRSEILTPPRPGRRESYVQFDVDPWQSLEQPIRVHGAAPSVYMLTSLFLLHNSRSTAELYLQTHEEYLLYRKLFAACTASLHAKQPLRLHSDKGHAVLVSGWSIGIYTANGEYIPLHWQSFYANPLLFLRQIRQYL